MISCKCVMDGIAPRTIYCIYIYIYYAVVSSTRSSSANSVRAMPGMGGEEDLLYILEKSKCAQPQQHVVVDVMLLAMQSASGHG